MFAANVRFSWLRSANAGLYVVYNEIDTRTGLGPRERELVLITVTYSTYSRHLDLGWGVQDRGLGHGTVAKCSRILAATARRSATGAVSK